MLFGGKFVRFFSICTGVVSSVSLFFPVPSNVGVCQLMVLLARFPVNVLAIWYAASFSKIFPSYHLSFVATPVVSGCVAVVHVPSVAFVSGLAFEWRRAGAARRFAAPARQKKSRRGACL